MCWKWPTTKFCRGLFFGTRSTKVTCIIKDTPFYGTYLPVPVLHPVRKLHTTHSLSFPNSSRGEVSSFFVFWMQQRSSTIRSRAEWNQFDYRDEVLSIQRCSFLAESRLFAIVQASHAGPTITAFIFREEAVGSKCHWQTAAMIKYLTFPVCSPHDDTSGDNGSHDDDEWWLRFFRRRVPFANDWKNSDLNVISTCIRLKIFALCWTLLAAEQENDFSPRDRAAVSYSIVMLALSAFFRIYFQILADGVICHKMSIDLVFVSFLWSWVLKWWKSF